MKKKLFFLVLLTLIVFLPKNVKAYCSDAEMVRLQKLASNVNVTYIYNAYGKVQSKVNSNLTSDYIQIANNLLTMNVMLYKGYCYDRETGLYYCKARYYNPELCRWMSLDSIEYLEEDRIIGISVVVDFENVDVITSPILEAGAKVKNLSVKLPDGSVLFSAESIKGKVFLKVGSFTSLVI